MYMMSQDCDLRVVLTPLELLGSLLAGLCHDIDHPGVNNAFMCASGADLSLLYNDLSVLENHHAAVTWNVSAAHIHTHTHTHIRTAHSHNHTLTHTHTV